MKQPHLLNAVGQKEISKSRGANHAIVGRGIKLLARDKWNFSPYQNARDTFKLIMHLPQTAIATLLITLF